MKKCIRRTFIIVLIIDCSLACSVTINWLSCALRNSHLRIPASASTRSCSGETDFCTAYNCYQTVVPCESCQNVNNFVNCSCSRFTSPELYNGLNAQGKRWLNATLSCMAHRLHAVYSQRNARCTDVMPTLLKAVIECPTNNGEVGICDIFSHAQNRHALGQMYHHPSRALADLSQVRKRCSEAGTVSQSLTGGGQLQRRIDAHG